MKSGARLVREVEQVVDIIKAEVEKGPLTSISFMFGATHLYPREVSTIMIPQTTGCLQTNSGLCVHLFSGLCLPVLARLPSDRWTWLTGGRRS